MPPKLSAYRKKIDDIDTKVLELLNDRAKIAIQVGKEKAKYNKAGNFHVPERERQIFERLAKINKGPFPNESIQAIYKEIVCATLSLEKPLKIAYLGPEATFTHLAGLKHFGHVANYIPLTSIKDVFTEVERGRADYGVVPIENSIEGVVNHTLDLFVDSTINICAEIYLEISHNLLATTKSIKKIKKLYSHPQPVAQCRNWLESNLPNVTICEVGSTAIAAEKALKEPAAAAIASEAAASLYNLKIVAKEIEDSADNFTRFLVTSKNPSKKSGSDKTSILFSLEHKAGALFNMLEPFVKNKINMTKIESRPLKKKAWQYVFFVDLEGHIEDKNLTKAMKELEKQCLYTKVLGSYPKYQG